MVALLAGKEMNSSPLLENICYSFVDDRRAAHVASTHRYDAAAKTMLQVEGRTEVSAAPSTQEGAEARAWARDIWADMLS